MATGIILARGGSKSIPKKNIMSVGGRPLIYWTLKAAADANHLDKVYVSTNCAEISKVVNSFCFSKVEIFERSEEFATDTASSEEAIIELIDTLKIPNDEVIQFIQATSPMIVEEDLKRGYFNYLDGDYDTLLSVSEFKRFIWRHDGQPINYNPAKRPRRQDFKGLLLENGGFYIFTAGGLRKYGVRLYEKIGTTDIGFENSIELDEFGDLPFIEAILRSRITSQKADIKLFATDVDGTLTDGKVRIDSSGKISKSFNFKDGMGFSLLRDKNILTAFITGETDEIVDQRAKKLGINYICKGKNGTQKLESLRQICSENEILLENVAYIGDDINDLEALASVGLSACPSDSHHQILSLSNINKLVRKGGSGCVREFIDLILCKKSYD